MALLRAINPSRQFSPCQASQPRRERAKGGQLQVVKSCSSGILNGKTNGLGHPYFRKPEVCAISCLDKFFVFFCRAGRTSSWPTCCPHFWGIVWRVRRLDILATFSDWAGRFCQYASGSLRAGGRRWKAMIMLFHEKVMTYLDVSWKNHERSSHAHSFSTQVCAPVGKNNFRLASETGRSGEQHVYYVSIISVNMPWYVPWVPCQRCNR